LGWLSRLRISSALLCGDAGWLRELVVEPDLLFSRVCGEAGHCLEDDGFKGGCQNWTRLKSTVAIVDWKWREGERMQNVDFLSWLL
jgi:hypothetical protein